MGGLIGYMENDATLTESYAVVDIASYNSNTGGLFALAIIPQLFPITS